MHLLLLPCAAARAHPIAHLSWGEHVQAVWGWRGQRRYRSCLLTRARGSRALKKPPGNCTERIHDMPALSAHATMSWHSAGAPGVRSERLLDSISAVEPRLWVRGSQSMRDGDRRQIEMLMNRISEARMRMMAPER